MENISGFSEWANYDSIRQLLFPQTTYQDQLYCDFLILPS